MSVTVRDVARVAGVSTATVSRVLNHSTVVPVATRTSVNAAIARLGYRQDIHAACLGRKRSVHRFLEEQDGTIDRNGNGGGAVSPRNLRESPLRF